MRCPYEKIKEILYEIHQKNKPADFQQNLSHSDPACPAAARYLGTKNPENNYGAYFPDTSLNFKCRQTRH